MLTRSLTLRLGVMCVVIGCALTRLGDKVCVCGIDIAPLIVFAFELLVRVVC